MGGCGGWFERWGSPIAPPGSDDYHPKHSTTPWCFFGVFFWVIAAHESSQKFCSGLQDVPRRPTTETQNRTGLVAFSRLFTLIAG